MDDERTSQWELWKFNIRTTVHFCNTVVGMKLNEVTQFTVYDPSSSTIGVLAL